MVAWLLKFNIWSYIFLNFDFVSKCVYKYVTGSRKRDNFADFYKIDLLLP